MVHPSVPANNVQELVAYLKTKPGEYAYSSSGIGSPHHIAGEMFKLQTGVDIRHVPYKGAAAAMNDLMGGQIKISFATLAPAIPVLESGRARALGVTSQTRSIALPQVPSLHEAGVLGFEITPWFGFGAPASLPEPLRQQINASFNQVLSDPKIVGALEKLGVEQVKPSAPEELSKRIQEELRRYGEVIQRAGITVDS